MMTGTEPVMRPETGSKGPTGAGRVLWLHDDRDGAGDAA